MRPIVEQLQLDAQDEAILVSTLLRRVKFAAVKLGLGTIEDWVEQELSGYTSKVPDYRVVRGIPKAHNPARGLIPLIGDERTIKSLSQMPIVESVASLEDLLNRPEGGSILISYSQKIVAELERATNMPFGRYSLQIDRNQVAHILDRVRTLILDWALSLERAGITGANSSFGEDEKRRARESPIAINIGSIGTFTGNLGVGNTARDVASNEMDFSRVSGLVTQIKENTEQLCSDGADRSALKHALALLEQHLASTKPDVGVVRGLLRDVRNAVSGAAGNVMAAGIITVIGQLLGSTPAG